MQTLYRGTLGRTPWSSATRRSTSWCLLIGQPRSSKSTSTWSEIGVLVASVLMYSGVA